MHDMKWKCSICGATNSVEPRTLKRTLMCNNSECNALYRVTGIHVNGAPMITYQAKTSKLDRKRNGRY